MFCTSIAQCNNSNCKYFWSTFSIKNKINQKSSFNSRIIKAQRGKFKTVQIHVLLLVFALSFTSQAEQHIVGFLQFLRGFVLLLSRQRLIRVINSMQAIQQKQNPTGFQHNCLFSYDYYVSPVIISQRQTQQLTTIRPFLPQHNSLESSQRKKRNFSDNFSNTKASLTRTCILPCRKHRTTLAQCY